MAGPSHDEPSAAISTLAKLGSNGAVEADDNPASAVPLRAWLDPPARSERSTPNQHLAAASLNSATAPAPTGTLNCPPDQEALLQMPALSRSVADPAAIEAERVSRPVK